MRKGEDLKSEVGMRNAEKKKMRSLEGVGHSAWGMGQSVQQVENKRITTEGHGAARKDSVCKFVVSVEFREDPW